jgi:hypothetical protein
MSSARQVQLVRAKGVAIILPPPPPPRSLGKNRKNLSADALVALVRRCFAKVPDPRQSQPFIPLADALMSAFAMFILKDPSLLAFDGRRNDANLKSIFGIGRIPCDTAMREILDPIDPEHLRPVFDAVFRELQRGKVLERFEFLGGYLLSLDGTGFFSSEKVHCPSCQVKNHKNGTVTYQHQMLGAVLMHPDRREVIPLMPEPIQKQDGETKNDCERNAARRFLEKFRRAHPHLKVIVVEDGLASNAPHVRDLKEYDMHFILGVKPGDHAFLFDEVELARLDRRVISTTRKEHGVTCKVSWVWGVPLNESNQDLKVDFLEYTEFDADGKCLKLFTWITDLHITCRNAWTLAQGGRSRWHIENETFNTLKNQGYHFEHNYGHGEQNLSVIFAMLMMLAFLADQTQQLCCPLFHAVLEKLGSKRSLWELQRSHFYHFLFQSMWQLYEAILYDRCKEIPWPTLDSS